MAAVACLGAAPGGVERHGDCGGTQGQPSRGAYLAEAGAPGWGGDAASPPPPARTPKLSVAQRARWPALLAAGAVWYGMVGEVWRTKRVAVVVKRVFGVSYHPAHGSRLLRQEGLRLQNPSCGQPSAPRTRLRRGRRKPGPPCKPSARRRPHAPLRRCGGLLSPSRCRPHVYPGRPAAAAARPLAHDQLSLIGALTPDGRRFTHIRERAFYGPAIVAFLRQLLRQVWGTLLVMWDGAPIHRCQAVKDVLVAGAAQRLHLPQLPA